MTENKNFLDDYYVYILGTEIKEKGRHKGERVFSEDNEYISLRELKNLLIAEEESNNN